MASKQSHGSAINGNMSKCPIMTSMEETIKQLDGNKRDQGNVDKCSVTDSSSRSCCARKSNTEGNGPHGNTCSTTSSEHDSQNTESKTQTKSETCCVQNTCTGCPCAANRQAQDIKRHSQPEGTSKTEPCSMVQVQFRKVSNISNVSSGGSDGVEEGERKLDLRGLIDSVGTLLIPVVSTTIIFFFFPFHFILKTCFQMHFYTVTIN